MRRFVITSTLFILPILVFVIGVEYILRQIPNDYSCKAQWLDEHAGEVECIVLGSSHAGFGIQPQCFPYPTFNVSHVSQSLNFDFFILNKYEKRMRTLRKIILPISYFTLLESLEEDVEAWRVKSYVLYYDYPAIDRLAYKYNEIHPLKVETLGRLGNFLFLGKNTVTVDSLGWFTTYSSDRKSANWKNTGYTAAKRHTKKHVHDSMLHRNIMYIDSLIQIANRHCADVYIVNTPTHAVYREHLSINQLNLMHQVCDSIVSVHSNVFRLDYFSDSTFDDDDFFDADHLNDLGAERFSKILVMDIDSLSMQD